MQNHRSTVVACACGVLTTFLIGPFVVPAYAADTSTIVNPTSGIYSARDVLTSLPVPGGFTVANGQVHMWTNDWTGYAGYQVGNISTGSFSAGLTPSFSIASNGYGDAFGAYDAANGLFYAGTYDWAGSGMYRYNTNTQVWSSLGVFNSLYGLDIHQGDVYASGLNAIWNGSTGQGNQIALYDLTGGSNHDVLIQAGGNSANVALDISGNVYYASYEGSNSILYRWTAAQIQGVRADRGGGAAGGGVGDLFLTYNDAQKLTLLPGGANGIAVDLGGNVFVTVNGAATGLLMWNSSMGLWSAGDQDHYETIADLESEFGGWLGALDTEGDFLNGGTVYLSNMGSNGLAAITQTVPEPSAFMFLAGGIGILAGWRKRNRGPRP